jgi:hypothetical protein
MISSGVSDSVHGDRAATTREDWTMRAQVRAVTRILAVAAGVSFLPAPTAADSVNIGINIGTPPPPPPVVVVAPPQLVVIPGSPVQYAPGLSVNFFFYSGRYYTFHDGAWFYAKKHNGPWAFIKTAHIPAPVLGVPGSYYKIPPGQAKKMGGPHPGGGPGHAGGPGRGHKGKD